MSESTFLSINDKQTVSNYPYGRLKTTAYFSVEFSKTKGFRNIFQTINPKNGRVNAEKKDVYHSICFMINDNGFIKTGSLDFYGTNSINKIAKFCSENFALFTTEQIGYIYVNMLAYVKADITANIQYAGAKLADIKGFYDSAIDTLVKGCNDNNLNVFGEINIDYDAIKSKTDVNYQPYKISTTVY